MGEMSSEDVRRPGKVVRYTPDPSRHDPRWCREGIAISDERGVLVDTYWGGRGQDSHVLNDREIPTVEHLFWMDDYRELDCYHRGTPAEWETYAETDRQRVTSQHGLQRRYFIRVGAEPDLATQVQNARHALTSAQYDLEAAQRQVTYEEERLDALLDLVDQTSSLPEQADPC